MPIKAIVMAGGKGSRMDSKEDKMLIQCAGKPLIKWVIENLDAIQSINQIIVIGNTTNMLKIRNFFHDNKKVSVLEGTTVGPAYSLSIINQHLTNYDGSVIIIDGDLPLLPMKTLSNLIDFHFQGEFIATLLAAVILDEKSKGFKQLPEEFLANYFGRAQSEVDNMFLVGAMCIRWSICVEILSILLKKNKRIDIAEIPLSLIHLGNRRKQIGVKLLKNSLFGISANTPRSLKMCERILLER